MQKWLLETGFSDVRAAPGGALAVKDVFDALAGAERPADPPAVDALIRPAVECALAQEAPIRRSPPLTAIK